MTQPARRSVQRSLAARALVWVNAVRLSINDNEYIRAKMQVNNAFKTGLDNYEWNAIYSPRYAQGWNKYNVGRG
jgi:hypothetical protein